MENRIKERDTAIDVMRGILILLVVLNHITGVARKCGVDSDTIDVLHICRNLYVPFFMPAFFIVTGLCSNFRKPLFKFFVSNCKTIIFPSIILTTVFSIPAFPVDWGGVKSILSIILMGGGAWFLRALFLSKLLYWCIAYLTSKEPVIWSVLIMLMLAGIWLNTIGINNIWNYQQAFSMALFLHVGHTLRGKEISTLWKIIAYAVYITIIIVFLCLGIHIPVIVNNIYVELAEIPAYLILSVTGTIIIYVLSRNLKTNMFMEFLGQESIIIYLTHLPILYFLTPRVFAATDMNDIHTVFGKYLFLFIASLVLSSLIALAIKNKHLRWIKGQF